MWLELIVTLLAFQTADVFHRYARTLSSRDFVMIFLKNRVILVVSKLHLCLPVPQMLQPALPLQLLNAPTLALHPRDTSTLPVRQLLQPTVPLELLAGQEPQQ
jgi:hypothetical protein